MADDRIELTPMQRLAYEIIEEILEIKRGNTEPCVAHITEIRNSMGVELMEALRGLFAKGIISVSKDLNQNPMFQIKKPI